MDTLDIQRQALVRVVDDDEGLRSALELMISYAGWKVACYPDARSFLVGDRMSVPGCIVLDYLMPGMTGLELQEEMIARGWDLPVIFLTGHAELDIAVRGFRAGAADFLCKPVSEERLLQSIEDCVRRNLLDREGVPGERELRKILAGLSDRQRSVLSLMREGLSARQISERLGISVQTVYEYRTGIYRTLGTKNIGLLPAEVVVGQ